MSLKTTLRTLLVLYWFLTAATIALSLAMEAWLPAPLAGWNAASADSMSTASLAAWGVVVFVFLVLLFAASAGLFFFKRRARWVYLATVFVFHVISIFIGPVVEHALPAAVNDFTIVLSGVIIGMVFFSGVLKPPAQPAAANAAAPEDGGR